MNLGIHPYELIPLNLAGYVLGLGLLLGHLFAWWKSEQVKKFLLRSSRNHALAMGTLALGLFWFFLLVAPKNLGILSSLRVSLAEFEGIRWLLQLGCPLMLFLLATQVKNLLFPRALGLLMLMVAAPFLASAYLKDPVTRVLIPIWAYAIIILGLIWVAKPYIYRNMVQWVCAEPKRWVALCWGGAVYGLIVFLSAVIWW